MGRRSKKSNSAGALGLIIFVMLVLFINYGKYLVWPAAIFGVGYFLYKIFGSNSAPKAAENYVSDHSISYEVSTGQSSTRFRSNSKESLIFHSESENLSIAGVSIFGHLIYVGASRTYYPHLIDPSLSVGKPNTNFRANIGYWPSYHSITADDRATYLYWLADGRKFPEAEIGLVFLFFYGLEHRAITEKKDHLLILKELIRLYRIYAPKSRSFARYCSQFIAWLCASNQNWIAEEMTEAIELYKIDLNIKKYLQPILSEKLTGISDPDFLFDYCLGKLMLFVPRNQESLQDMFKKQFLSKASGLAVAEENLNRRETLTFYYSAATALRPDGACSYSGRKLDSRIEKKMRTYWVECEAEISGFVRLQKEQSKLLNLFQSKKENESERASFLQFISFAGSKICKVEDVLSHFKYESDEKLTPTESKKLSEGLENYGVWVEPDSRLSNKSYKMSDMVVMVKDDLSKVDMARWQKAIPLFDLSISVAIAEGDVDSKEVNHTIDFIAQQFKMNEQEKKRLQLRAISLKEAKISMAPLAKKLSESMNEKQKHSIARFLFSIAALDGTIQDAELKALDKTYKAFAFPINTLDEMIAEFSAQNSQLVVLKSQKKAVKKGSSIPRSNLEETPKSITLDKDALSKAFAEASDVASILATVFVDEGELQKPEPEITAGGTLTDVEDELLQYMKSKSSWDVVEIEDLCRAKGMMYGAFLNKVNEWSEQACGHLALEEDGDSLLISNDFLRETGNA